MFCMKETLRLVNREGEFPHKKYVVILGPSLSGKSTVVHALRDRGLTSLQDPENSLFTLFLKDPQRYAFAHQLNISTRLMELETHSQLSLQHSDPHFAESGVLATQIYNRYLHDKGYLSQEQFQLLDAIYHDHMKRFPKPDLVIFFDAPVDVLKDRALHRFGMDALEPEEMRKYWEVLLMELRDQGIPVKEINTSDYSVEATANMILEEVKRI